MVAVAGAAIVECNEKLLTKINNFIHEVDFLYFILSTVSPIRTRMKNISFQKVFDHLI